MKTSRNILIGQMIMVAALFAATTVYAGQSTETPKVVIAKMETRAVSASLAATLHGILLHS